jgi:hypothetical protein
MLIEPALHQKENKKENNLEFWFPGLWVGGITRIIAP